MLFTSLLLQPNLSSTSSDYSQHGDANTLLSVPNPDPDTPKQPMFEAFYTANFNPRFTESIGGNQQSSKQSA
jgi:hypothetical protein